MTQFYFDPSRANDSHALPDAETFFDDGTSFARDFPGEAEGALAAGWYWQACFPGCLPDGEPVGPFETEGAAIADAQKGAGE